MLLDSLFEGIDMKSPRRAMMNPRSTRRRPAFGEDLIYLVSSTGNEMGGR
jgi:hypothetical protein